jgi:hypothetical protein
MELKIKKYRKENIDIPIYKINGTELSEKFLTKNNILSIGYGGGGFFDKNKPYEIVFKNNERKRYSYNEFEIFIKECL